MVNPIPEGVASPVPYLCVRGGRKAIDFYQKAFGAQLVSMMPMGDDLVGHADLKIGTSRVYLADEMPGGGAVKSPATLKGTTATIHLWVEDCDAVFAQAAAAGAKVVMPLVDQFWGDRYGVVADPFGHMWAITSHKEDLTPEEMTRRGAEAMTKMAQTHKAAPPKPRPAGPKPRKAKAVMVATRVVAKPTPRATTRPVVLPAAPAPSAPVEAKKPGKAKKDKKAKKSRPDKKGKKSKKSKKSKKDKKRKNKKRSRR